MAGMFDTLKKRAKHLSPKVTDKETFFGGEGEGQYKSGGTRSNKEPIFLEKIRQNEPTAIKSEIDEQRIAEEAQNNTDGREA